MGKNITQTTKFLKKCILKISSTLAGSSVEWRLMEA